jgi:hypothetical protein
MARKGSRKSRIFSTLYSPISHLLRAGKKSVGSVTNAAKGVVGKGLNGVNGIGRAVTGEMNEAVHGLKRGFTRKGGRRNNVTRRNRRNRRGATRKNY